MIGTGITAAVTDIGVFLSPLIISIIGASGVGESLISQSVVLGLCGTMIKKYNKKITLIKEYIDKASFLFQKIIEDQLITLKELTHFQDLMNEYEKQLMGEGDVKQK